MFYILGPWTVLQLQFPYAPLPMFYNMLGCVDAFLSDVRNFTPVTDTGSTASMPKAPFTLTPSSSLELYAYPYGYT